VSITYIPGTQLGYMRSYDAEMRGAALWWDPNNVGLSAIAAYRAINTVGTPWSGGPANYAESLVNNVAPGVNDLVEGNGAVPWAAAAGWGFVAAAAQYFDTGLVPANDQSWSVFVQYANTANANSVVLGAYSGAAAQQFQLNPNQLVGTVVYLNGGGVSVAPSHLTGNMAVVGAQGYRDGIADGAAIGGWGGASTRSVFIACLNFNGPASFYITADIESVVIYDAGPAAVQAEVAAIAAAMAAL
jgi:hypothetical protein